MSIRENDSTHRNTTKYASCQIYQDIVDEGIRTCKLDNLNNFTEKEGNFQVCAKGQLQHHQTVEQGIHNANKRGKKNQKQTETGVHDNRVPQWMTNGHIAVIGHYCKEKTFQTSKHQDKVDLCKAACISDALILCLDVHQHLWDCGGAETDVSQGQVVEKEIHGGVEVGVRDDGQDDEQVSQDGNEVYGQEQNEEEGLQFWILCHFHKKEF